MLGTAGTIEENIIELQERKIKMVGGHHDHMQPHCKAKATEWLKQTGRHCSADSASELDVDLPLCT